MRTMRAKFPGYCQACSDSIEPGDTMVHLGKGRNYHQSCYADEPDGDNGEAELRGEAAMEASGDSDGGFDFDFDGSGSASAGEGY